jgi:hypothetical protein
MDKIIEVCRKSGAQARAYTLQFVYVTDRLVGRTPRVCIYLYFVTFRLLEPAQIWLPERKLGVRRESRRCWNCVHRATSFRDREHGLEEVRTYTRHRLASTHFVR